MHSMELFDRLKMWKLRQIERDIEKEKENSKFIPTTSALEVYKRVDGCENLDELISYFAEDEEMHLYDFVDMILAAC